jgi:ABC-type antimicrobial peptide transport system permease subunit
LNEVTGLYVLDSIITGNRAALISSLKHLILPSISLGATMAAIVARVLRSSMLEVLRQDYITLARAKGQMEFLVIMKHAVRNALIPTVTVVGLQVGALLGRQFAYTSQYLGQGPPPAQISDPPLFCPFEIPDLLQFSEGLLLQFFQSLYHLSTPR